MASKIYFHFLGGGTALQIVDYGDCLTFNLKKNHIACSIIFCYFHFFFSYKIFIFLKEHKGIKNTIKLFFRLMKLKLICVSVNPEMKWHFFLKKRNPRMTTYILSTFDKNHNRGQGINISIHDI